MQALTDKQKIKVLQDALKAEWKLYFKTPPAKCRVYENRFVPGGNDFIVDVKFDDGSVDGIGLNFWDFLWKVNRLTIKD